MTKILYILDDEFVIFRTSNAFDELNPPSVPHDRASYHYHKTIIWENSYAYADALLPINTVINTICENNPNKIKAGFEIIYD